MMQCKEIKLPLEGSMDGAVLQLYILDNSEEITRRNKRKVIVICPGGGYGFTSDREAEVLGMSFLAKGYHVAILRYSVAPIEYPMALMELGWTVKYLREHAEEFDLDPEKIVVQGSSAGGHLAASFATFYKEEFLSRELHTTAEQLKPNGLMLSYPVITSGKFAHQGSMDNLLGDRYQELKEKMSLENRVHKDMPKTFIWHTFTDPAVPVENSLLFVMALREKGIATEFHMFPVGGHGLGLANELTPDRNGGGIQKECEIWIDLALAWMTNI